LSLTEKNSSSTRCPSTSFSVSINAYLTATIGKAAGDDLVPSGSSATAAVACGSPSIRRENPPATEVLYMLEPRLTLRHCEVPRTRAAGSAREGPRTGDRTPSHCSRQRQRVATRRFRHHLEVELARHVAIKVSSEGERPALRLSRHTARPVRREIELVDA